MSYLGWFDGELRADAWFDAELQPAGWFDTEIINTAAAGGAYTLTAQHGTYAVTGQTATLLRSRAITASSGTYSLSGQSVTLLRSKLVTATNGTYAQTGQSANITYIPAASAYTLTAQSGSYSLTGQSATILRSKRVTLTAGAYSVAGQQAAVNLGKVLTASQGTYSVTGQSATLTKSGTTTAYVLTAQGGSYTVTGSSAGIVFTPADNFADTHDGYFTNTWLAQWKKKPELAEVVEYVEAHPQEALEVVQSVAPKQAQGITVAQIDYSTKIAELLAKQILYAISRRQVQIQQDEDDVEFLLLMD